MADFQRPLLSATDEGQTQYAKKQIPSFGELKEQYNLVIAGHTCNVGSDNYNQKLSDERGKAVVVYLTKKGVNNAYVGSEGYGETQPAVKNTYDKRKLNRRAEFKVKIRRRR